MRLTTFFPENWPLLLVCALGLVAVYVLLPRPRRMPVLLGMAAGVAALVLAGWLVVRVSALTIESFLFYFFSAAALIAGALLVTQQNPARAALSFALVVLATCGIFLIQAAPFLMAATIIVYAGAIIVTFLFVLMLAQQQGQSDADARSREPFLATLTGFLLLAALLYVLKLNYKPDLDRWVKRTEHYLERVRELEQRNADDKEKVALAEELDTFVKDYNRWWIKEVYDPNNPETPRPLYPSGGKLLADTLVNFGSKPDPAGLTGPKPVLPREDLDKGAFKPPDLSLVEEKLQSLLKAGIETRNNPLLGNLRPTGEGDQSLSELSGPRSSRDLKELRRDEHGRPRLPARNVAYLGRSLFGDYLLAVELAGMLLLVATVGAIVIAARRPSPAGPAPSQERTR
jgi:NADH-quinone oxidoreductase subunit J